MLSALGEPAREILPAVRRGEQRAQGDPIRECNNALREWAAGTINGMLRESGVQAILLLTRTEIPTIFP
jgi:hypothetical protein